MNERKAAILRSIVNESSKSKEYYVRIFQSEKNNYFSSTITRATVRRYIKELVEDGLIDLIQRKKDGLSDILTAKNENPLVYAPNQLIQIREEFLSFVSNIRTQTMKQIAKNQNIFSETYGVPPVLGELFSIYADLGRLANYYSIRTWPAKLDNAEVVPSLYGRVFEILGSIQATLLERFDFLGKEKVIGLFEAYYSLETGFNENVTPSRLYLYLLDFEGNGLDEQAKRLIDAIWEFAEPAYNRFFVANRNLLANEKATIDSTKAPDWTSLVQMDIARNPEVRHRVETHPNLALTKYRYYIPSSDSNLVKIERNGEEIPLWLERFLEISDIRDIDSLSKEELTKEKVRTLDEIRDLQTKRAVKVANAVILLNRLGLSLENAYGEVNHLTFNPLR